MFQIDMNSKPKVWSMTNQTYLIDKHDSSHMFKIRFIEKLKFIEQR